MFVSIIKGRIKYAPTIKELDRNTIINFVVEPFSVPLTNEVKSLIRCSIDLKNVKDISDFQKGRIIFAKGVSSNIPYDNENYVFNLMVNYYEIEKEDGNVAM